ncbi:MULTISPECIES: Cof-type HAD-IIB family hydrolase [Vagococcus]|uniref:Hydrolase (HAD superfamily) n=1 Tax=Vagococcus fluvialis bH819 TaxID=1255619 RepID=A0A1X6WKM7_9ENTE|nr:MULTISPECIES: Cof-type HAD-IIB family hydrolase [Vagococcus]SLM84799.1 Hydrolase (HAD superfamily) [Vagococcus fluvialis bH819]HCM89741.1 Cof-type HAD-IIB family hydrolase [Vagococcus sp.]
MTKIAFFDVDGTLCNSSGEVLESSVTAIRKFREAGNLAYICTGRSKPEIIDSILEVGFDGIIGAGGGYIVIDEQVVSHKRLPKEAVLEIINFFGKHDVGYYLESNDGLFGSENCERKIKEEVKKISDKDGTSFDEMSVKMQWFFDLTNNYDNDQVDHGNVNKISFINNTIPFKEIDAKFGEEFHMYHSTVHLFGPESGEIAVKGIDKQNAVNFVLNYLNLTKDDAIAFGDGDNDLAMFEAVGYKIAMANATDNLKAVADEITADADEDGIAFSLEQKRWE